MCLPATEVALAFDGAPCEARITPGTCFSTPLTSSPKSVGSEPPAHRASLVASRAVHGPESPTSLTSRVCFSSTRASLILVLVELGSLKVTRLETPAVTGLLCLFLLFFTYRIRVRSKTREGGERTYYLKPIYGRYKCHKGLLKKSRAFLFDFLILIRVSLPISPGVCATLEIKM